MTKPLDTKRCRWCGRGFEVQPGPGRPKEFCRPGCRQADYVARQRSAEVGISEAELIVTRQALDDLRDRLYVLETAVADVEGDLAEDDSLQAHRDAVRWLLEAAKPLVGSDDLVSGSR